jgi:hypothetical protein
MSLRYSLSVCLKGLGNTVKNHLRVIGALIDVLFDSPPPQIHVRNIIVRANLIDHNQGDRTVCAVTQGSKHPPPVFIL